MGTEASAALVMLAVRTVAAALECGSDGRGGRIGGSRGDRRNRRGTPRWAERRVLADREAVALPGSGGSGASTGWGRSLGRRRRRRGHGRCGRSHSWGRRGDSWHRRGRGRCGRSHGWHRRGAAGAGGATAGIGGGAAGEGGATAGMGGGRQGRRPEPETAGALLVWVERRLGRVAPPGPTEGLAVKLRRGRAARPVQLGHTPVRDPVCRTTVPCHAGRRVSPAAVRRTPRQPVTAPAVDSGAMTDIFRREANVIAQRLTLRSATCMRAP